MNWFLVRIFGSAEKIEIETKNKLTQYTILGEMNKKKKKEEKKMKKTMLCNVINFGQKTESVGADCGKTHHMNTSKWNSRFNADIFLENWKIENSEKFINYSPLFLIK